MNVSEPIRRQARLTPNAIAIIRADDSTLSYAALDRAIDHMAGLAAGLGLRPGDIAGVGITGPDESLGLILALALARLGVASANPSLPVEHQRLTFDSGDQVPPGVIRLRANWMPAEGVKPADPPPMHSDPDAVFRIFASSGTTGRSKHIPLSHALMERRTVRKWLADGDPRPDIRIVAVNLGAHYGMSSVLRTLWSGGTLVLAHLLHIASAITRHGVTTLTVSPASLLAIIDALPPDAGPFPSLRMIDVAGSHLPGILSQRAAVLLSSNIWTIMGSTEASGVCSGPMAALAGRAGAAGYVWPGVEVQAVDDRQVPVPPGIDGTLRMRGDLLAEGYFGGPLPGPEGFHDGWFYPGDVGAVWPDGMITLSGRVSERINSGGRKISPEAIEDVLLRLPTVLDAAAFGMPGPSGVEVIGAAIVARARIDEAVLQALCQRALATRSPSVILQLNALPRNANGKVMRQELAALAVQWARANGHRAEPVGG